jgi:hypothetical protein
VGRVKEEIKEISKQTGRNNILQCVGQQLNEREEQN